MERLYVLIRQDISPGLQLAQVGHAVHEFGKEHPDFEWTNIAVLGVRDEEHLRDELDKCHRHGVPYRSFFEEDVDSQTTAAVAGTPVSKRLFRHLPLALGGVSVRPAA